MKQDSNHILVDIWFFLDDVDEVKLLTLVVLEKNTPLGRAESAAVHKKVSSNGVICAKFGKR